MKKSELGITILEIIISIAVIIPALACTTNLIHSTSLYVSKLREIFHHQIAINRLTHYLEIAIDNIDSSTYSTTHVIFNDGLIKFTDDSLHPIMNTSPSLRPLSKSSAIATINLLPSSSLWIINRTHINDSLNVKACPQIQSTVHLDDASSLAALTTNSTIELKILSKQVTGQCYNLSLKPSKSLVLQPPKPSDLEFIQVLIPIKSISLIYLSNSHELRYLSAVGDSTLENQPIIGKIENLNITQPAYVDNKIVDLETNLTFSNYKPVKLYHFSQLARADLTNLLGSKP